MEVMRARTEEKYGSVRDLCDVVLASLIDQSLCVRDSIVRPAPRNLKCSASFTLVCNILSPYLSRSLLFV